MTRPATPLPHATASMVSALDDIGELLCKAVRALGMAGQPQTASALAARGWWATRDVSPALADHINGVMHFLATLPESTLTTPGNEEQSMRSPELDVRSESPARRHDLILTTYADLESGGGFVLVNDHDPKPLYYQFAAEYPYQFTWDYLESGPEVWRVRIGKPETD